MAGETTDLRIRAQHLFAICDKEEKGFVTKRDMQRMQAEMPLDPEQLELVFDSLDADGNGFLTFDEFIHGFGIYIENDPPEVEAIDTNTQEVTIRTSDGDEREDDENFMQLLDGLGGPTVFEDEKSVKLLWDHFRQDAPDAGIEFEKFLSSISDSIHTKEKEKLNMEVFIRNQQETREEELKRLYEEMERQIEEEKELVIRMERMKESQLKSDMREEITKKDFLLTQLQTREKELQEALSRLQENEAANKHDLALLTKEKRSLETQLEIQTRNAEELRAALEKMRRESISERRQRAMSALQVAENIAVEREGLVEQLSLLRTINTRLTDENDLRDYGNGSIDNNDEPASIAREIEEAAALNSDNHLHFYSRLFDEEFEHADNIDIVFDLPLRKDPDITDSQSQKMKKTSLFDELTSALNFDSQSSLNAAENNLIGGPEDSLLRCTSSGYPETNGFVCPSLEGSCPIQRSARVNGEDKFGGSPQQETLDNLFVDLPEECLSTSLRGEPKHSVTWSTNVYPPSSRMDFNSICTVETSLPYFQFPNGSIPYADSLIGYHNGQWINRVQLRKSEPITPSAVFKIIVLGESGVGKTSFIRRFCCDDYVGSRSATVGIDLSIRCLPVGDDNQYCALQFWDTAGQEKYRSISRQYVRKADGVLIMYDVTSEMTFVHVRYWIDCVKEVVGDDVVCLLVGNKRDLLEQQEEDSEQESTGNEGEQLTVTLTRHPQRVLTSDAMKLAQTMGLDFFETSAKTGYMIQQSIVAMAAKLQVREKVAIEKIVLEAESMEAETANAVPKDKAKKCCRL
ncbi:EF-hand calcium-binding domain-containing protein 4B-like isoform X2 [Daphnia carinata]|uniref:EF-hand calcium-binding domain-containing protein 4B-like isoform X2 n=1 Tax=Daphnia carinata TaxID=120202 RepID=UPI00257C0D38|nr:EF-hand calcium-binding domain-containing protein 4B-like isoform X2 [Daphnia carinata]